MNEVLIDTDIFSYYLKGDEKVLTNINHYLSYGFELKISLITYYEITSGLKAINAFKKLRKFESIITDSNIVLPSLKSIDISAEIYGELRKKGQAVDDMDLLIAGIAIENQMILITNNVKHFDKIPDLKIQNWTIEDIYFE